MPKLLQINVTCNWGSHGTIAESIARLAMQDGWECYTAFSRGEAKSVTKTIRIGSSMDKYVHGVKSLLFDNEGLNSTGATKELVNAIKEIQPDIIHLHNIHGHFLNYRILFEFLREYDKPVVWTLHDCWSFTGHCSHFERNGCFKWRMECYDCKFKRVYPKSLLLQRCQRNYNVKKDSFRSVPSLTLVPVSEWLERFLHESFLKDCNIQTIHNGVDLNVFRQKKKNPQSNDVKHGFCILGVSSVWPESKGLADFVRLRSILPGYYRVILIGLSKKQIRQLPSGIHGIGRTNNVEELVKYYNDADVFINPTYEDNFPTVNLEALACGTPVITYRTGGSPEAIDEKTGIVVEQGNVDALADAICKMRQNPLSSADCRRRAEMLWDKDRCFEKYVDLYNRLLKGE